MKKSILSVLLSAVILIGVCIPQTVIPATAKEASPFNDIKNVPWAQDAIAWGVENGIVNGTSENTFSPSVPLNRAMFATMLTRVSKLLGCKTTVNLKKSDFSDIPKRFASQWYFDSVNWMYLVGAMQGTGKDADGNPTFSPERDITRQEMAAGLSRYLREFIGFDCASSPENAFSDLSKAASWAKNDILKMTSCGLFQGVGGNRFSPTAGATRAEAIVIFYRAYQMLTLPENLSVDETVTPLLSIALPQRFRCSFKDSFPFKSDYWTLSDGANVQDGSLSLSDATATTAGKLDTACGALSFTASYDPTGEKPFAGFDASQNAEAVNIFDYCTAPDTNTHTYTIVWMDNHVFLFFMDGTEVARTGELYDMEETEDAAAPVLLRGTISVSDLRVFSFVTPFSRYGAVYVDGANMYGESGEFAQLYGANLFVNNLEESSVSWQTGGRMANYETMRWLRDDWGISSLRLMIELDNLDGKSTGYIDHPAWREQYRDYICERAEIARRLGIYLIVDWHVVSWGNYTSDPFSVMDEATEFFDDISDRLSEYDNVLYETANEPGVSYWSLDDGKTDPNYDIKKTLKYYHEYMIDVIRANDPNALIIASSPNGCNSIHLCANSPLDPERYPNVVYVCHAYPRAKMFGTNMLDHYKYAAIRDLPIFVTEFGPCSVSAEDDNNGIDILDPTTPNDNSLYAWLSQFDKYGSGFVFFELWYSTLSGWNVEDGSMSREDDYIRNWIRAGNGYQ